MTNLDTGRVAYYAYPQAFLCFATDHKNSWILSGGEDGSVRRLESPTLTDDDGAAISWEVQSKDFLLQTRLHFPRWLKYDVDASSAATCYGALYLDGTLHHTHTISGSRETRRRLMDIGNGNKAAIRIYGTGPSTVYAAELGEEQRARARERSRRWYQENKRQPMVAVMAESELALVPYLQLDGKWSLPDERVYEFAAECVLEGVFGKVFVEGDTRTPAQFLKLMQLPSNFPVFIFLGTEIVGAAWLNGVSGSRAFGHFLFLRSGR